MPPNTQITGNVGMFYVCYLLSKRGWNALPTSRNTAGIDIVIHNPRGTKMKCIQVKTLNGNMPHIQLRRNLDWIEDEIIWFIVTNVRTDNPNVYIMSGKDVRENCERNRVTPNNPTPLYWLSGSPGFGYTNFLNNWKLIGSPDND